MSLIVSTYNRASYLTQSLDSLLQQSRPPDEIIVVDDGSDDDTSTVAARYAGRVQYYRQRNQGKAAALNFALTKVSGSYVCFFDDDDIMLPDALQMHLAVLAGNRQADYTYSPNLIYDEAPERSILDASCWRPARHPQIADPGTLFIRTLEWGGNFLTYLQGMLVPMEAIRAVGPFENSLLRGQDYDMMLRLAHHFNGVSVERPTFVMRNHNGLRGPTGRQHTDADRLAIWHQYNRAIILPYRHTLALGDYLPRTECSNANRKLTPDEEVSALLQRSRIMFSHGLFVEGVADIGMICSGYELDTDQRAALSRFVTHAANIDKPHLFKRIPSFARALARVARHSTERHTIRRSALKGFYWGLTRVCRQRKPVPVAIFAYAMWLSIRPF